MAPFTGCASHTVPSRPSAEGPEKSAVRTDASVNGLRTTTTVWRGATALNSRSDGTGRGGVAGATTPRSPAVSPMATPQASSDASTTPHPDRARTIEPPGRTPRIYAAANPTTSAPFHIARNGRSRKQPGRDRLRNRN